MDKSRLQSITILLLTIGQILINIRMSSYVRDMNSLKDRLTEFHQLEFEYFQLFGDELQEVRLNYQQFLEAIQ